MFDIWESGDGIHLTPLCLQMSGHPFEHFSVTIKQFNYKRKP